MKLHGLLAAIGLGLSLTVTAAVAASSTRPNIVVLLADDWGYTDVGAYGSEIKTPNIDELARRGTRFSNFHVAASCSPTRSMLLTGVDNHRNGVGNLLESMPREHMGKPGYLGSLNRKVVTVASLLQEGGYRTYIAGKWNVGKERYNLPDQRGFDRSLIQADTGSDNWETARTYLDLSDKVYWYEDGKPATMPAEYYSSSFFVDKAIEYIDSGAKEGKPFFAYVGFQANHIPVQAPRAFIDKYKGRYNAGWTALRQERRDRAAELGVIPRDTPMVQMSTTADWNALSASDKAYQARRMEVYAGMADALDFHVGRLIEHLTKTGEFDNTVFVFMSDNGAEASDPYSMLAGRLWLDWQYSRDIDKLGDKGAYSIIGPSWASAAASPLSTYKFYSGEGGIRVPLIIAGATGAGAAQANQINHGFAHVNDIAPTLLQLAQLPLPGKTWHGQPVEAMSGASLLPVLQGQAARAHAPDEATGYELSGNQALFKGDLKLIRNIAPVGDGLWHLYDIVRDPGETRDLSASMPEAFQSMQAQYAVWATAQGVLPMPAGYAPQEQVLINALISVYLPRMLNWTLIALPFVLLLGALVWWRRRRTA